MSAPSFSFRKALDHFFRTAAEPFFHRMAEQKATAFFLITILIGCLLACLDSFWRIGILITAVLLSFLLLLLAYRNRFWYAIFLPVLAGFLVSSLSSLLLFDGYVGSYQRLAAEETVMTVRCEVMEVVYTNAYSGRYICRVTGEGMPWSVSVQSENPGLQAGMVLTGEIRLFPWEETDDGFDEERYYLTKGTVSAAEDISLRETGETRWHLRQLFQKWNQRLSARISAHVHNDGLPLAMLLGNRSELADTVKRDFRRLGILHLLSVSGTHFSMLAAMAERFMIRLRIRPVHRCWLLGILTVLYMLLTGLSASVRRAGLMFLLALLCRGLGIQVRYFSSLNIACGLILLFDPFAVLDMGLHLSYLAICGCLLYIRLEANWPALRKILKFPVRLDKNGKRLPPPKGWRRFLSPRWLAGKALSMLLLNLMITALTFPLSFLYFGELSFASLLVNLIYIPLTGAMLVLTLFYLLLYPLRFATLPLAALVSALAAILEIPASGIAKIPHVSVSLQYPFIPFFILPMVLTACLLPLLRRKLRGIGVLVGLFVLMNVTILLYNTTLQDQSLAVYRNDRVKDGFVIRSGGEVLLVDISDGSKSFTRQLLSEASELYATEIGGYMITHYHNRHVSTLQYLADNWILRTLYLPEPVSEKEEDVFRTLLTTAEDHGIETIVFDTPVLFENMDITLAGRTYLSRSTHPITGLVLSAGEESLVYVSSSFSQGDPAMLTAMEQAEVGIFGAHSPVYKKTFALSFARQPKILVWNGDAPYYYAGLLPAAGVELYDCRKLSYRFPDTTDPADAGDTIEIPAESP